MMYASMKMAFVTIEYNVGKCLYVFVKACAFVSVRVWQKRNKCTCWLATGEDPEANNK
jgi:hypothetical protein